MYRLIIIILAVMIFTNQTQAQQEEKQKKRQSLLEIIKNEKIDCPDGAKLQVLDKDVASNGNYFTGKMKACIQPYRGQQVINGKAVTWYPNGQKAVEANYKPGVGLDGIIIEWDNKVRKTAESNYKNGQQDGESTVWQANGDFKTTSFKNGRPHGREFGKIRGITFEHEYDHGIKIK